MHKPLKVNLYLEDELPKKKPMQMGGFIDIGLINNNKFKYLRADNIVETFIHGASKVEENIELWFEFQNVNNVNRVENISYMDRSNNSISFIVKQLKKYSNVKVKNLANDIVVLKLIELNHKSIDLFIEEWTINKQIFDNSIIDIYMYGNLYTKDNIFICNYIITKYYENHHSLLKLNYNHTMKYIIKIMLFLQKCYENNIIIRNFKFSALGYEFINSEIQFIILDYDDATLIRQTDNFFNTFSDGCDTMCAGTLVPYFIIEDFFEMVPEWKNKLDKLYSIGLAETLIFLLYTQDEIMENLFKIIYNPSYLKPCLHYYHFMKIFDNETNTYDFFRSITSLKPKFVEIDSKIINPMFTRIIQNCFDTKYNVVKSPMSYLQHINKAYSDYDKEKSNIKTFIEPIRTIDYEPIPMPIINELVETIKPVETIKLIETIKPVETIKPIKSLQIIESGKPIKTLQIIESGKPVEITKAIKPDEITKAIKPDEITKAIKPVESTKAIKPDEITKAIKPVESTKAIKPDEITNGFEVMKPVVNGYKKEPVSIVKSVHQTQSDKDSDDMIYIGSSTPKMSVPIQQDIIGGQLKFSDDPVLKSIIKIKSGPIIRSVKKVGFLE